jgi:uncharacterized protein YceH (UPF0502 family)
MNLSEDEVRTALAELEDVGLASPARGSEGRVTKYAHHIGEVFNLRRGEQAVLCVLLLRGAQTPGELRGRTERMHSFAAIDEVESVLQQLAQREPPLAGVLPREPGAREMRYVHLLSSAVLDVPSAPEEADQNAVSEKIAVLERELAELRARIGVLEDKLTQLTG